MSSSPTSSGNTGPDSSPDAPARKAGAEAGGEDVVTTLGMSPAAAAAPGRASASAHHRLQQDHETEAARIHHAGVGQDLQEGGRPSHALPAGGHDALGELLPVERAGRGGRGCVRRAGRSRHLRSGGVYRSALLGSRAIRHQGSRLLTDLAKDREHGALHRAPDRAVGHLGGPDQRLGRHRGRDARGGTQDLHGPADDLREDHPAVAAGAHQGAVADGRGHLDAVESTARPCTSSKTPRTVRAGWCRYLRRGPDRRSGR